MIPIKDRYPLKRPPAPSLTGDQRLVVEELNYRTREARAHNLTRDFRKNSEDDIFSELWLIDGLPIAIIEPDADTIEFETASGEDALPYSGLFDYTDEPELDVDLELINALGYAFERAALLALDRTAPKRYGELQLLLADWDGGTFRDSLLWHPRYHDINFNRLPAIGLGRDPAAGLFFKRLSVVDVLAFVAETQGIYALLHSGTDPRNFDVIEMSWYRTRAKGWEASLCAAIYAEPERATTNGIDLFATTD